MPVRLTDERWAHILGNRSDYAARLTEILRTVASPDLILEGAPRGVARVRAVIGNHHLLVVYREMDPLDGFIITAYETSKPLRRPVIMAEPELTPELLDQFEELSAQLARLPFLRIWTDYDKEVDCLYINFVNPKETTDSEGLDNGMIVDYRGPNEEVVGVTVLDASKRGTPKAKVGPEHVLRGD